MAAAKIVTHGAATFVLKDGGAVTVPEGGEVPDGIADGQLEHKQAAGAFDEPAKPDWDTLARIGIGPAPASLATAAPAPVAMPPAPVPAGIVPPSAQ